MRKKFQHLHAMALPRPKQDLETGFLPLENIDQSQGEMSSGLHRPELCQTGGASFLSPFRSSHHRLILPIRTENNDENSRFTLPTLSRFTTSEFITLILLTLIFRFKLPKRSRSKESRRAVIIFQSPPTNNSYLGKSSLVTAVGAVASRHGRFLEWAVPVPYLILFSLTSYFLASIDLFEPSIPAHGACTPPFPPRYSNIPFSRTFYLYVFRRILTSCNVHIP
ncbi:hypothetical protein B0H14DRAFT_3136101, partial [Mycena olivaceomarginata]